MSSHPHKPVNFGFDGEIPLSIYTSTVEELNQMLYEHESQYPGSYMECCTDGKGNYKPGPKETAYREWAAKHIEIKDRIKIAIRLQTTRRIEVKSPRNKKKVVPYHNIPYLTEQYMQSYNRLVNEGIGSENWESLRNRLYNLRRSIARRCKIYEVGFPDIPEMPNKPRAGRCTPRTR